MFKPQELQFTFTAKRSCSQLLQSINSSWNFSEGRTHWSMMQSNTNVRRSEALLNEQQWQQIERLLEYWAVNHVTAVNPAALHWRNISTRSSWGTRSLEQLRHVLLCRRSALRLPSVLCWGSGRCCGCSVRPARSLRWSEPPRWPLTRPASSSPAPPVESKSWADRAVRLSLQRSAEKREAAETRRASLRDQLKQHKHTQNSLLHICSYNLQWSRRDNADKITITSSLLSFHITARIHIHNISWIKYENILSLINIH